MLTRAYGKDVWSYYSENDVEGQLFAVAMFNLSQGRHPCSYRKLII
jgi:hypothetical protein